MESAIQREQRKVTWLYGLLDAARERAERSARAQAGGGGGFQQRVDRETAEYERYRALAQFAAVEHGLCFGRIDARDGDTLYVGRMGLRDEEGEPVLIDWRAPAARPFYTATSFDPGPLTRRRHIHTRGRRVVDLDDEVFDLAGMRPADRDGLVGEAALLATLRKGRTGRMSDVVATIQSEQDEVVRAAFQGVLVVQGGPGTGKTVAALHRAAYLLYTHRETLSRRGVLIIGPNPTFLRYIERVLPGLGETDVGLATPGELFPGVHATAVDPPRVAVVKGGPEMADLLRAALDRRRPVPGDDVTIEADGMPVTLSAVAALRAHEHALSLRAPHNIQRRVFVHDVLAALAEDQLERMEKSADEPLLKLLEEGGLTKELKEILEDDSSLLRDEHDAEYAKEVLWQDPAVRALIDGLWPEFTPQEFLADLYADREFLEGAGFAALHREPGAAWTLADVPLLDEAAELLGYDDREERARERREESLREEEVRYALGVLQVTGVEGVTAADLAERQREDRGPVTAAERLADRDWAYGHIIVDEAQELSAMAWRAVMRRVPTRSMTVVGDLAQTGNAAGARSWGEMLSPYVGDRWRELRLLVNYRTPAGIMRLAEDVLAQVDPKAEAPKSVREEGDPPTAVAVDSASELPALVEAERVRVGEGRVAVITSAAWLPLVAAALPDAPTGVTPESLDEPVVVLTAGQSKGLEFDAVIVADPAGIVAESDSGGHDLYVAVTRATRRLTVAHAGPLPAHLRRLA
ncbi:HelD family protein [Actinocorallia sp. A-T 12471]|uniref:HelD family protein n=1 Tax=Actinocorallia sp. A-T 12471 TaxID=3089813 RepID=UPI0029D363FE|nr:ATP-binding domain-containing protein [Actinocorallia sp. A-T 12471]MDX6739060.1 ATP-binding domain-containing protein [Actinocorallia sp. A-T 12471]